MRNITILSAFLILLTCINTEASKKSGVDLDLIDWEQVCPAVEPVTLNFPNGTCTGIHPTELEHYESGVGGSKQEKPKCGKMKERYKTLTNKNARYNNWKHCKMAFQVKYTFMLLTVDKYSDTEVLSFRNQYLSQGIVDPAALKKTRATIRETQAAIERKKTQ